jgi:hypothetical protein
VSNALGIVALKFQNHLNQTNSEVSRLMGLKLCCSKMGVCSLVLQVADSYPLSSNRARTNEEMALLGAALIG